MVESKVKHLSIIDVKSKAMQHFDLCLCRSFAHTRPTDHELNNL